MISNGTQIIEERNLQRFYDLIPVVVYMALLSIVGVFGNVLVIFIYTTRFPKTSSSYFILCLAVLDLLTCAIGVPFDTATLAYWFNFPSLAICKILRFVSYFTVMASAVTLIVIAFDRYYKVCNPLKRFSAHCTKILIGMAVGIGLTFTWPAFVIFGDSDNNIIVMGYNVSTVKCSVSKDINKMYPVLYYAVLVLLFLTCTTFLIILYTILLNALRKQNKRLSKVQKKPDSEKNSGVSPATDISIDHKVDSDPRENKRETKKDKSAGQSRGGRKNLKTERTTMIFLVISCVYVLSYLPCLTLIILRTMIPEVENFPSVSADVVYQMFMRSYFINNAVNPIIYGLLNPRFRKECVDALRPVAKMCYCGCFGKIKRYSSRRKQPETSDVSLGSLKCSSDQTKSTDVSDTSRGSKESFNVTGKTPM